MKIRYAMLAIPVVATAPATGQAPSARQDVVRALDLSPKPGSPDNFTGRVKVAPVVKPEEPGRTSLGRVEFSPGARSFWHTHPAGQILVVTAGCGWTQQEGGPVRRICKGDVAYVGPNVRHWHGATATTSMTHLAVT